MELQDIPCMLQYNQRMRDWMKFRDEQKPVVVYPNSFVPLREVIDKFYGMC